MQYVLAGLDEENNGTEDERRSFVEALGCLPLALKVAASSIRGSGSPVKK